MYQTRLEPAWHIGGVGLDEGVERLYEGPRSGSTDVGDTVSR